jgi:glycosyltransferase 2 family protein
MRLALGFGLAGLVLATALVAYQGIATVFTALSVAGFGIIWASLFHIVPMASNARAWHVLLGRGRRPNFAYFTFVTWLRESINALLPVARIGGEVVSARLLIRHGLRPVTAAASLVVDMTVSLVSQFTFTLLGLAVLIAHGAGGGAVRDIVLGLAVTVPVVAALFVVQRVGLFTLAAKLFRALFAGRFDALVGGAVPLDRAVRRLYRRRRAVLACFLWQLAGWSAGSGEIWLALLFLGHPVALGDAFAIEAVIQALSSSAFVVPAALGVQEGGFLVVGGLVGLSPELALALALVRRARDVIIFVPALLLWQIGAGRRALSSA